ncbi:hypothetical protein [Companilactobacillus sp. HBUAS59544]|uniref:hypothetical protein n=1 Tax=Companilactobacillus sp. HBUAS59544 TaxID=3109363 RepID=UPI002FEF1C78
MQFFYNILFCFYPLVLIFLIDKHFHIMDVQTQQFDLDLGLIISKSYVYTIIYLAVAIPLIVIFIYLSLSPAINQELTEIVAIVSKGIDILLTGLVFVLCGSQLMILNRDKRKVIG